MDNNKNYNNKDFEFPDIDFSSNNKDFDFDSKIHEPHSNTTDVELNENNLSDDFVIGQDFFVEDDLTSLEKSPKKAKKSKNDIKKDNTKAYIWVGSLVLISAILAYFCCMIFADYFGFGEAKSVDVEITKGMSISAIAKTLKENGVIKYPFIFKLYSKTKNYDAKYKYGVYTFRFDDDYSAIANKLVKEGAQAEQVKVTINEGLSIDEIAVIMEENGICTAAQFKQAAKNYESNFDFVSKIPTTEVYYKYEGYLYPDTYQLYNTNNANGANRAIERMLQNMDNKLTDELKQQIEASGYSFHEVLTLASIIELEAGNASYENKCKVSAVFNNRLSGNNWNEPKKLQSDPTMKYPYGSGRYNTYESEGLPPGPLCSPSIESIKAAVNPTKDFDAVYFVTDKNMQYYFTETYKQHRNVINDLKNKGLWA